MKRYVTLGLRLIGVALVVLILWRIQYLDRLLDPNDPDAPGRPGTVGESPEGDWFEFARERPPPPLRLPDDWEDRPDLVKLGLFTNIRRSDKLLLALCAFLYGPITLISITRWWYLLKRVDIPIGYREAFRLTFIGFFFNSAMPGLTGGDVIKAVYIARHAKGARVRAFMSVFVDRVIGLFALGVLSALVILPNLGEGAYREAAAIVFAFVGACIAFGAVFLSRRLRRLIRFETILRWLPFSRILQEVDRAVVIYRRCPGAVLIALLLSLGNHISLVLVAAGMGHALGMQVPAHEYFILVPVCMMVASIPLLPGGWGAREGAFVLFFGGVGVAATQAFALSVLIGLMQLAWSLLGGWFFLTRPDRVTAEEVQTFSHEVEAEVESPPANAS